MKPMQIDARPLAAAAFDGLALALATVAAAFLLEVPAPTSTKLELPVQDQGGTLAQAGPDASFSAAVAAFGMLLRGSGAAGDASWASVRELAQAGRGADADGNAPFTLALDEPTAGTF